MDVCLSPSQIEILFKYVTVYNYYYYINYGNGYWIREQYNFERIGMKIGFVALMANIGYCEEFACSMNSWTVCDSYHSWPFQAIPFMHVC
jgi:hypothetical protein